MQYFLHFIVNKQSRNSESTLKKLLIELPQYTNQYTVSVTENLEQLDNLIQQLKEEADEKVIIVIVGGDGSLNQVVSFLEKYQLNNYIGYIPSGSGNDFARAYNLPTNIKKAVKHLFEIKEPQQISIIHASQGEKNHYAVNSLGLGLDGMINYKIETNARKKYLGEISYISSIFSAFAQQDKFPVTIKVDEGVFNYDKVQLALIANNPYFGGGIEIMPEADGKDDYLDVLIANDVSGLDLLRILPKILINKSHLSYPKLYSFQTKEVALYTDSEQFSQKDGEVFSQKGFAYVFRTKKRNFWI